MSNHVHLMVRPLSDDSLYKMMQGLTLCYTQYVNRKYQRTGRLWESRYHSCIVDKEQYLWAVARYIEQNPVRAKIVKKAEAYPYSSAETHVKGAEDTVLGEELFSNNRRGDYIGMLRSSLTEKEKEAISYHTRVGRPFGNDDFIYGMEKKLKRPLARRPRGRPKKERA